MWKKRLTWLGSFCIDDFSEVIAPLGCIHAPHLFVVKLDCPKFSRDLVFHANRFVRSQYTKNGQIRNQIRLFGLHYISSLKKVCKVKTAHQHLFIMTPSSPSWWANWTSNVKSLKCLLKCTKVWSTVSVGKRNMKQKLYVCFAVAALHSSVMNQSLNTAVILSVLLTLSPCCAV